MFRVLAALAVIINVLILLPDFQIWLTDQGLYTRQHAMDRLSVHHWSLYHLSGATWYALALLLATLASATALLFGWHTRVATIVTWVLVASLANRISILTSAADTQLTVMLFWAMFLPLGARFSIDSALAERKDAGNSHFSIATVALLLQVAYLYFFGALLKTGSHWRETYDAVYYAVTSLEVTTPLAPWLAQFPDLLRPLTVYVYWLELLAILFLFTPFLLAKARLFVLPQLVLMHIGFALFLSIAIFPLVSIAGLMAFIPALFWDRFLGWWNARPRRTSISIHYDRDCGFCLKTCLIFRELGLPPDTPVVPAQDDPEIGAILERENSWVVRTHDGRLLTKWAAVAYIWRRSPLLWPFGAIFMLPFARQLGEMLYLRIAAARPALSRLTATVLPFRDDSIRHPRRPVTIVLAFLMTLVFAWNVDNLRYERMAFYFPYELRPIIWTTRLAQRWNMFSPQPIHISRWLVVEGISPDGGRVDLLFNRPHPPSYDKPRHGLETFPNYRWRKYYSRVDFDIEGDRLGEFYCTRARRLGHDAVTSVIITRYLQRTVPPGRPENPVDTVGPYEYPCEAP